MRKLTNVDLGLTIHKATDSIFHGVPISEYVTAELCQCTAQNISLIYSRAMNKVRKALSPEDWETLNDIFIRDREKGKPTRTTIHQ